MLCDVDDSSFNQDRARQRRFNGVWPAALKSPPTNSASWEAIAVELTGIADAQERCRESRKVIYDGKYLGNVQTVPEKTRLVMWKLSLRDSMPSSTVSGLDWRSMPITLFMLFSGWKSADRSQHCSTMISENNQKYNIAILQCKNKRLHWKRQLEAFVLGKYWMRGAF
jgi:hypothetical protein